MYKYLIEIKKINKAYIYEISMINKSIKNLIIEIDNDNNLDYINEYKDDKYNILFTECKNHLIKYNTENNITIKKNIEDITYCILLFLLVFYNEEFTRRVTYQTLKDNLPNIKTFTEDLSQFSMMDWNKLVKNINYELSNDYVIEGDISFITFTNYGYIKYIKNLIESLKKCNFPLRLKIYCIDEKSYNELENYSDNIILEKMIDETINETITGYLKEGWSNMMITKMKVIYKELQTSNYVLYTDGDIVFKNNYLIKYLIENIKNKDILIQKKRNNSRYGLLCQGFMLIQSNNRTKDLFNIEIIDMSSFNCDQDYINQNKGKVNYSLLRRELFPIESYYCNYLNQIPAFIIHFTNETGDRKEKVIKYYGYWYLEPEPEPEPETGPRVMEDMPSG